jgi:hypothetical protein
MLIFKQIPLFYCEIDAGAGGGSPSPVPVETPAADTTGTDGGNEPAKTGEAVKPAETAGESQELSKMRQELARRTRALKGVQKERDELRSKYETKPADEKPETKPAAKDDTHPALIDRYGRPLEEDDEGLFEDPETGLRLTKAELIKRYNSDTGINELRQELNQLKSELADKKRSETEAEYQKRIDKAQAGVLEVIETAVSEEARKSFPDYGKEGNAKVDKRILATFDDLLGEAQEAGETFSETLVERLIKEAIAEERSYIGLSAARQIDDNTKHKENYPVKPGGQPGSSAPAKPQALTRAEKDRINREAGAAALKEMGNP